MVNLEQSTFSYLLIFLFLQATLLLFLKKESKIQRSDPSKKVLKVMCHKT